MFRGKPSAVIMNVKWKEYNRHFGQVMINTEMKGSRVLECLQKEVSYGISRDLIFTDNSLNVIMIVPWF